MLETRGDPAGWPAARRCLASTEIKNIDSHSHAGLHRSSIRFSPARQYPFFPRTVRGTNCSCIPAPALPLTPSAAHRNPKHKGSLFHLAALSLPLPPTVLPALPSHLVLSRPTHILRSSPPRVCARSSGVRPVQMYGDVMLYIID